MYAAGTKDPPTIGKVVLNTTLGPLDVELWAKEAPKATRNFVQLCLDGFYDRCAFFRVIPSFIAQTGDPTNTGNGPRRTYLPDEEAFPNELHSRLRFTRRGLLATAGTPEDASSNANQFFITLDKTPELEKQHTIFGKVVGDSVFNLLSINEMELEKGSEDRLADPPVILSTTVVWNPFDDIFPRAAPVHESSLRSESTQQKPQSAAKAVKNFAQLSFGDEAEEDEVAFSSTREKVTFAPSRSSKAASKSSSALDEAKPASRTSMERATLDAPLSDQDEEETWQKQMNRAAKEWQRAGKKADRRDERREQRMIAKKRILSGKTESDSDEADIDEDGNPTYRRRKEGEEEDIIAPKFKKRKVDDAEDNKQHRIDKSLTSEKPRESRNPSTRSSSSNSRIAPPSSDETNILAKLAAFKTKLAAPGSVSKSSEEDDWKSHSLTFDPALEREGNGSRDMQRDDYVVYDSTDTRSAPSSSTYRSSDSYIRDERKYDSRRDYSPERRRHSPQRSPSRRSDFSPSYRRYDSSPSRDSRYQPDYSRRSYGESSSRTSQRDYNDQRAERVKTSFDPSRPSTSSRTLDRHRSSEARQR